VKGEMKRVIAAYRRLLAGHGVSGRSPLRAALLALLLTAPCLTPAARAATLVRYLDSGVQKTASIDLAQVFANPKLLDGKFGWQNVSIMSEAGRKFARVRYPAGSYNPGDMKRLGKPAGGVGFRMKLDLPDSGSMRISYYVRFAPDFPFVKGGKLPGLGGGKGNTGGKIPDGYEGFSSRFMWRDSGDGEVYAYLPSSKIWGTSLGRGSWRFPRGIWTHVEQSIRLNTPGNSDGEVTVWQNGKQVHTSRGLKFRETDRLRTDLLIFETFFGGATADWATPVDTYADFADLTVSTGE
jgi:hypothetical protein